jgi:hypothetical protein
MPRDVGGILTHGENKLNDKLFLKKKKKKKKKYNTMIS